MDNSIWLSSIFGPFLVILGLWMLLYTENMIQVMDAVRKSPAVLYLMGVINLLIGLFIVSEYNMWSWQWNTLVSLLGWIMIVRGVVAFFIPQLFAKWMSPKEKKLSLFGIIPLVYGLLLCWVGFFY